MKMLNAAHEGADAYAKMMEKIVDSGGNLMRRGATEAHQMTTAATVHLPKKVQDRSKYDPSKLVGKR